MADCQIHKSTKALQHMLNTNPQQKLKLFLHQRTQGMTVSQNISNLEQNKSQKCKILKTEKSTNDSCFNRRSIPKLIRISTASQVMTQKQQSTLTHLQQILNQQKMRNNKSKEQFRELIYDCDNVLTQNGVIPDQQYKPLVKLKLNTSDQSLGRGNIMLESRIKDKINQRKKELELNNYDRMAQISQKIQHMDASKLYKKFLIKQGYRLPQYINEVQIKNET